MAPAGTARLQRPAPLPTGTSAIEETTVAPPKRLAPPTAASTPPVAGASPAPAPSRPGRAPAPTVPAGASVDPSA